MGDVDEDGGGEVLVNGFLQCKFDIRAALLSCFRQDALAPWLLLLPRVLLSSVVRHSRHCKVTGASLRYCISGTTGLYC